MDEQELLDRYALAISLIPDADAAADIYMEAAGEADLRRRAGRWRAQQKLPPAGPEGPLPRLDAVQREHALHLARRAGLRRRTRPWLAVGAAALLLASWVLASRVWVLPARPGSSPVSPRSSQSNQIIPLTLEPRAGRVVQPSVTGCRRTALTRSSRGEPLLLVSVPYAISGRLPSIASAMLHLSAGDEQPAKVFVDVRATPTGAETGCYMLLSAVTLPDALRGRQVEFTITVRPARVASGTTWSADPIWVP
jgi:hypothetical protein